jgi:hypothetical protein
LIDDQNGREASSFALGHQLFGGLPFDLAAAKLAAAAPGPTVGIEKALSEVFEEIAYARRHPG